MLNNYKEKRIIGMTADLKKSVYLQDFRDKAGKFDSRFDKTTKMSFGGKFIQHGISEANMCGIAIGLAIAGKRPYAATFSTFMLHQLANIHMANYMDLPVTIITTHTGVGVGEDGPTHQMLDASLLKNFQNTRTFEPCNAIETYELLKARYNRTRTVDYFRLTRQKVKVFKLPYKINSKTIDIGAGLFKNKNGIEPKKYIIASGATVWEALEAQKILANKYKIFVDVINIYSIDAPNLGEWLRNNIHSDKDIFTFQDAYPQCLCDVVSSVLCGYKGYNFKGRIISVGPTFGKSGKQKDLYSFFNIDKESIVRIVRNGKAPEPPELDF
jgi:transketolase